MQSIPLLQSNASFFPTYPFVITKKGKVLFSTKPPFNLDIDELPAFHAPFYIDGERYDVYADKDERFPAMLAAVIESNAAAEPDDFPLSFRQLYSLFAHALRHGVASNVQIEACKLVPTYTLVHGNAFFSALTVLVAMIVGNSAFRPLSLSCNVRGSDYAFVRIVAAGENDTDTFFKEDSFLYLLYKKIIENGKFEEEVKRDGNHIAVTLTTPCELTPLSELRAPTADFSDFLPENDFVSFEAEPLFGSDGNKKPSTDNP